MKGDCYLPPLRPAPPPHVQRVEYWSAGEEVKGEKEGRGTSGLSQTRINWIIIFFFVMNKNHTTPTPSYPSAPPSLSISLNLRFFFFLIFLNTRLF